MPQAINDEYDEPTAMSDSLLYNVCEIFFNKENADTLVEEFAMSLFY